MKMMDVIVEIMKNTAIESRPRQYGKSVYVVNKFLAECKLGGAIKFEGLDFVCFSKKAYAKELALSEARGREEALKEIGIPRPNSLRMTDRNNKAFVKGYRTARNFMQKSKELILKKGNQTLDK